MRRLLSLLRPLLWPALAFLAIASLIALGGALAAHRHPHAPRPPETLCDGAGCLGP